MSDHVEQPASYPVDDPWRSSKRVIVARHPCGELFTIGPVFADTENVAITNLEAEVRAAGVDVVGVAKAYSRAEFRGRQR